MNTNLHWSSRGQGAGALAIAVYLILHLAPTATPQAAQGESPSVVFETTLGKITIELYPDKAPVTVKNFLQYVDDRFYDGPIFHRVIRDFMIQGGGHEPGLKEKKARPPIQHEPNSGLSNLRGTIALARTAAPDSGTSQFFINVKDNRQLDGQAGRPGYTVFGKVVQGMEVVDKIRGVKTQMRGPHADVPVEDVVIRSARRAGGLKIEVGSEFHKARAFSVVAYVAHPQRGATLTLELPDELEIVEGKTVRPVPTPLASATSVVVWQLRGNRPGTYAITVRSNVGLVQKREVRILD